MTDRPPLPSRDPVLKAAVTLQDAVRRLADGPSPAHVGGCAGAAASLLLAATAGEAPTLVVVADEETARRTTEEIATFLGAGAAQVLRLPAPQNSPYAPVAPDRRTAMERLAVLARLHAGEPWRFLVVPASALLRKVVPSGYLQRTSLRLRLLEPCPRETLLETLEHSGYLRVPVAEDPGTYAVRGGIVDVFPPQASQPVRIELDDDLVASLRPFDPDSQRTDDELEHFLVPPALEVPGHAEARERAARAVRERCDELEWPTRRAVALAEEVRDGRLRFGLEALLPAYHGALQSIFEHLPAGVRTVVVDPPAVGRRLARLAAEASDAYEAALVEGRPAWPPEALLCPPEAVSEALRRGPLLAVHRFAVAGEADEEERQDDPLAWLSEVGEGDLVHLGGEDHGPLVAELRARRQRRDPNAPPLAPLAERLRQWQQAGLQTTLVARSHGQAERLRTLLRGHGVEAPLATEPSLERFLHPEPGALHIAVGGIGRGFLLGASGLALLTEEEIFGTRSARRRRRPASRQRLAAGLAIDDLRDLKPGDYVVHVEHGVGRYLGLQQKTLAQSQADRMAGRPPLRIEVLVVEYKGGDKLYLPVTRLNQVQRFAGTDGRVPKLDRLGGQSFARTKARVRKEIRHLADELLRLYAKRRAARREPLPPADEHYTEFEATFPYEETPDQARASDEVLADLESPQPMDRLVCGDVGFGKTEVALRAAFRVAMSGRQVALLCPTTVLAQQHYATFRDRFAPWPLRVEVLSRFVDRRKQREVLAGLKEGTVDVVVGTHRLLSKDVHFHRLGLLVVDEEQRFGVAHKERLKKLRAQVDVLTLSATPIPRTLQMAVGGLRELSLITTPPEERRAVRTLVCRWDAKLITEAIGRELRRGGQVFYVYNRVEGLYERAQRLQELLPEARIAVAHGQLKEDALERIMTGFVEGDYDVLVSTAIVESGLDIPRANTIVVDRADMFGLAQLYQLRGRVGRSRERAYCYLVTPPPSQMSDEARSRIEALERFTELGSGFHVATLDMELRGAGDLLGAEQSGQVASVGFDLYVQMLEEAVAELRGEPIDTDIDPELTLQTPIGLPEDYVADVGLRLSLYKRLASARTEAEVHAVGEEMEDRFGPPPPDAVRLVRAMALRPGLRALRAVGCEAREDRVVLHLRRDTPLDPGRVMELVAHAGSPWRVTPDLRIVRRFERDPALDAIDRAAQTIAELRPLCRT